ncbi:hypothetical protein GCM10023196_003370 [Actinoallomurus vinaceus]|uniref:Cation-transporting P-type ATPase N-terminal domain-containing protein n=1 Tax=Actinoallomurus vinaceus TaxID=1080074 RepID=A0ABP8U2P6_9ACTN
MASLEVTAAGSLTAEEVLGRVGGRRDGLGAEEAADRLRSAGPNAVRSHRARALPVLVRQLRSPLLILLAVTAVASFFVGERADALIIGAILAASVGLGFGNEYRAEKAAEALHAQISHQCVVLRDGHPCPIDVTRLVPGDVIMLQLGEVVPADVRLVATVGLECDESVLTGESQPAAKSTDPVLAGSPLAELACCALMGTVVCAGSGTGVVVATGGRAAFGRIALGLGERPAGRLRHRPRRRAPPRGTGQTGRTSTDTIAHRWQRRGHPMTVRQPQARRQRVKSSQARRPKGPPTTV